MTALANKLTCLLAAAVKMLSQFLVLLFQFGASAGTSFQERKPTELVFIGCFGADWQRVAYNKTCRPRLTHHLGPR